MAMSSSSRLSPSPQHPSLQQYPPPTVTSYDLELTIISGKHLKNVNWKNGHLKPYAIFWVDPDNKLTTKSDDSGSTKPVWNQRFLLPIPLSDSDSGSSLSIEIFHSKASESPKPFVGSLQVRLANLPDPNNYTLIRSYDLLRPSGRPQGKIRLKMAIKERPLPPNPNPVSDYQNAPPSGYYYSSAPPYPSRSVPYYPPGYYPPQPPLPLPRSFSERFSVPSAPVEYSQSQPRASAGGFGVGAVAGALGGMAIDEGLRYGEGRVVEKVEDNVGFRDDISDYRADY